ncbi:MAG: FecR domain-containing protein [Bacteroidota bacterium]
MKKEDLIVKWLDNNLDESELKAFKELDASSAFLKIDEAARRFKAPDFDIEQGYARLTQDRKAVRKMVPWRRIVSGIAAALMLSLGAYFFFFNNTTTTHLAMQAQKSEFFLPDNSEVFLNADSRITYDESKWQESRTLRLEGEAFFRVEKGSKFSVQTDHGVVSVLGTEFDVKARDSYFEVVCFEGLVQVDYNGDSVQLQAGDRFSSFGNDVNRSRTVATAPTWIHSKSSFTSVPYFEVIEELERQYKVQIQFDNPESATLFTGSFTHENLDTALQAITIPLNLSYSINGDTVTLKSK